MAHKINTGNRHIYKFTKDLKTQYDKENDKKKSTKTQRLTWHRLHARNVDTTELLQENHRARKVTLGIVAYTI